jgi:hypothetical protein
VPRKKKSLSRDEVCLLEDKAKYEDSFKRAQESYEQMKKKEGPYYDRWLQGMKLFLQDAKQRAK